MLKHNLTGDQRKSQVQPIVKWVALDAIPDIITEKQFCMKKWGQDYA